MFAYKRIVIAQHERGLYLKDRSIKTVLAPGVYRILDPLGRVSVEVYNLTVPEFEHPYIDVLVTEQSALCERHFQVIELNEYEVGLVYKNGKLNGVLAPATRQLYWKGPICLHCVRRSVPVPWIPCWVTRVSWTRPSTP